MIKKPIGLWQLASFGTEPGKEARAFADRQVSEVLRASGLAPGRLATEQLRPLASELSGTLIRCLQRESAPYDADLLIPALVGQSELLTASVMLIETNLAQSVKGILLPFSDSFLVEFLSHMAMPHISLRFLLEFTVAQPPIGMDKPSELSIQRMWSLAEMILEIGMTRDAVGGDLEHVSLEEDDDGYWRLVPTGDYATATQMHGAMIGATQIARLRDATEDVPRHIFDLVDNTLNKIIGLNTQQFIEIMLRAKEASDERGGSVCIAPRDHVIAQLALQDIPPEQIRRALDWLSLAPIQTFTPLPARYPWRFRRSQSYIRRPFVQRDISGQGPVLIWGRNHVQRSLVFIIEALTFGSLPTEGLKILESHNGAIGGWRGKMFEDELTQLLFRRIPEMWIKPRVEKLDVNKVGAISEPLPGDIDVLIADSVRHCLTLVEAKANLPALVAHDVAEEIARVTPSDSAESSDLDKHFRRLVWAERHLDNLVRLSGFQPDKSWQVQGRWVTKEPVASVFLKQVQVKITSIDQLRNGNVRDWLTPEA